MTDNLFDKQMPVLKSGEILCDACWKVQVKKEATGWVYFNFKFLKAVNLCYKCACERGEEMQKLQRITADDKR